LAILIGTAVLLHATEGRSTPAPGATLADYQRAEAVRPDKIAAQVLNLTVVPIWVPNSDRFWFREQTAQGWHYVAVDPDHRDKRPAFDHARLAVAISRSTGKSVDAEHLPLDDLIIQDSSARAVSFTVNDTTLTCDVESFACTTEAKHTADPALVLSPDGTMAVAAKGDNIWLKDLKSGAERQLTQDGEPYFSYGRMPDGALLSILGQSTGRTFPPYG